MKEIESKLFKKFENNRLEKLNYLFGGRIVGSHASTTSGATDYVNTCETGSDCTGNGVGDPVHRLPRTVGTSDPSHTSSHSTTTTD